MDILEKLKIKELNGEDFLIIFPTEIINEGYKQCSNIMKALEMKFPTKKFLGVPENLELQKFSTEKVQEIIAFLQEEIQKREENE